MFLAPSTPTEIGKRNVTLQDYVHYVAKCSKYPLEGGHAYMGKLKTMFQFKITENLPAMNCFEAMGRTVYEEIERGLWAVTETGSF